MNRQCRGIHEIYQAFTADAHAVYRAAMACSRGDTVSLTDLLVALDRLQPQLSGLLGLDLDHRAGGVGMSARSHLPVANDGLLREALLLAWRIAQVQPGRHGGLISPAVLLAAAIHRQNSSGWTGAMLCAHLGLQWPPGLTAASAQDRLITRAARNSRTTFSATPLESAESRVEEPPDAPSVAELEILYNQADNFSDVLLDRWLAAQKLACGPQRERLLASIRELAGRHL